MQSPPQTAPVERPDNSSDEWLKRIQARGTRLAAEAAVLVADNHAALAMLRVTVERSRQLHALPTDGS